MSHQAFFDALHAAKVRRDQIDAALDDRDDRSDDEGDELADREERP